MKLFSFLTLAAIRAEDECAPANGKICDRMNKVPDKLDAVCGDDGITYSNQCLFKHYKCITGVVVSKKHKGRCDKGEEKFEGSDLFNGPIVKHHCPVRCNKNRGSIVCGSDGVTYNNECEIMELQCAKVDVFFSHFGACCEDKEHCEHYEGEGLVPFDLWDHPGYDGHNEIMMDAVAFDEPFEVVKNEPSPEVAAYADMVRKKLECLRGCTLKNIPVCGTDGTTYPNECVLREQKCKKKPKLQVLNHGYCPQMVHNHMYDDYVEENRPDLVPDVDYESSLFQIREVDPPGLERLGGGIPLPGMNPDIRETLHFNTFYYQPEFEPTSDMLNDAAPGDSPDDYVAVEVVEEPEEIPEETSEEPEEEMPDCSQAYPKYINDQLEKCPSSREHYKPVCGSDNKTYYNQCLFESERCFGVDKQSMQVLHEGICEGDPLKEWEGEVEEELEEDTSLMGRSDRRPLSRTEIKQERLRKRQEHRRLRKEKERKANDEESPVPIMQRGMAVGKTQAERIKERLHNRVEFRKDRREKQKQKNLENEVIDLSGRMDMEMDVSAIDPAAFQQIMAEEEEEEDDDLDEELINFPELCSAIQCEEFAKTSNVEMCGRIKNMETQVVTEKIHNFRSRCFFKRKRCHLRKKAQQIFNQNLRKFNNLQQRSIGEEAPSKKDEPKFNHVGMRLKRADCTSGELITKDKSDKGDKNDSLSDSTE